LHVYAIAHPIPDGDEAAKLTENKQFEVTALYDTGAEVTRICSDVLALDFQQWETELCVLTFEYLSFCFCLFVI
jgi:hypothetical protein